MERDNGVPALSEKDCKYNFTHLCGIYSRDEMDFAKSDNRVVVLALLVLFSARVVRSESSELIDVIQLLNCEDSDSLCGPIAVNCSYGDRGVVMMCREFDGSKGERHLSFVTVCFHE